MSNEDKGFMFIFEKFNVLPVAIGLMVGASLKNVADNLIEDLLMPFIRPLIKKLLADNNKNKKNRNKFKVPGTEVILNLENIIMSSAKFFSLTVLIYLLIRFGIRVKKRPRRVRIMNWDKMPTKVKVSSKKKTRNLKLY